MYADGTKTNITKGHRTRNAGGLTLWWLRRGFQTPPPWFFKTKMFGAELAYLLIALRSQLFSAYFGVLQTLPYPPKIQVGP